jgi:TolB-like protein
LEKGAPDNLARLLYSTMASMSNWQIVSESEVREIGQSVRAPSEAARLKQIGERVYADAVITGTVQRFRERVGDEWGVKSPASVAFVLDLVDVRRGDVVWSARFDETQKSLSENILAIGEIGHRGVRWLTAEQLAHEGIKKAVAQLHQILVRSPTS